MRIFYFLAFIFFTNLFSAQVTFKPGIRAGANFSHFSQSNDNATYYYYNNSSYQTMKTNYDFKTRTDFYLGVYGNIRLAKFYALQPEINYSRQGSKLDTSGNYYRDSFAVSYLGTQLINKFYFNKFNVHIGPTIDIVVDKDFTMANEIDFGIVGGVGYDITDNFGIEARAKRGFFQTITFESHHVNVVFQAGVYYSFNLKKK